MESPERSIAHDASEPPPIAEVARTRPSRERPHPGLAVFGVFFLAAVVGGALLVLLPLRSAETRNDTLRSGTSPVGTVSVLSLSVGTGVDAQGRAVGGARVLPIDAREIDLAVDLHGLSEAVPVTARLVDERTRTRSDLVPVLVDRDRHMVFTFPRRSAPWETGRWRASILVNAVEAAYTEFDVR